MAWSVVDPVQERARDNQPDNDADDSQQDEHDLHPSIQFTARLLIPLWLGRLAGLRIRFARLFSGQLVALAGQRLPDDARQ